MQSIRLPHAAAAAAALGLPVPFKSGVASAAANYRLRTEISLELVGNCRDRLTRSLETPGWGEPTTVGLLVNIVASAVTVLHR